MPTLKQRTVLTVRAYKYLWAAYPAGVFIIVLTKIIFGVYPVVSAALVSAFTDNVLKATGESLRRALLCLTVIVMLTLLIGLYSAFSNYMNSKFFYVMYVRSQIIVSDLISDISSEYLDVESHQRRIDYILGNSMWSPFRLFNITTNIVQSTISVVTFFVFIKTKNIVCTAAFAAALVLYIVLMSLMGKKEYSLNVELYLLLTGWQRLVSLTG